MRAPRLRLTVRGWMIVVAVFAALIALGIQVTKLARLRDNYLENAAFHADAEQMDQDMLSELAAFRSEGSVDPAMMSVLASTAETNHGIDPRLLAERSTQGEKLDLIENHVRSMLKWHIDMKRKWQRAVDRPWEAVAGDSYYTYKASR